MKTNIRTTLIAGAIAALLAGPTWAASDTPKEGAQTPAPTKSEIGQPERDQPKAAQPMNETPRSGAAADAGATAGPSADNPLYTRSAADLDGVDVVDSTGDKIGEVKQIVLAPDRKSAHAVISVGGVLGMGARDVLVSLDELRPMGDKLQLRATKEEIAARKDEAPDTDKYVEVKGDTPISGSITEFSAFEQDKEVIKPGASPMTPKTETEDPATAPGTPKMSQ